MNALILAGGLGTRMRSSVPKVAHLLLGRPLLRYPIDAAAAAGGSIYVVLGPHSASLAESLPGVTVLTQSEPLGTGHAASLLRSLPDARGCSWIILPGDIPCIEGKDLSAMISFHESRRSVLTLGTTQLNDPKGYGRIVRDGSERVSAIVEESEAVEIERAIREVNAGIYVLGGEILLDLLAEIRPDNRKGEYFLTDIVAAMVRRGMPVLAFPLPPASVTGVNDRAQLAEAAAILRARKNLSVAAAGVTLTDPATTYVDWDVVVDEDTSVEPGCLLLGATSIGRRCIIEAHCRISDSRLGNGVHVKTGSVLEEADCGDGTTIGPMARLRPGTVVKEGARIGNFVEVKKSTIAEGSKVPHLSYIGDATIGRQVNVGAGTITCNYDGVSKHPTVIGDGAFIGSDTSLVAPVTVGEGAVIGAGSTITADVPPYALAVARGRQVVKAGWALKNRKNRVGGI